MTFKFYPDAIALQEALANKNVEGASVVGYEAREDVQNNRNVELVEPFSLRETVLYFNQNLSVALKDLSVRQAIQKAIDKSTLVNDVYGESARVIHAQILPGQVGYDETLVDTYDPSVANTLLTDSGYAQEEGSDIRLLKSSLQSEEEPGKTLRLTLTSPDLPDMRLVAEKIQGNLRAIGMEVELSFVSPELIATDVIAPRNFELLLAPILFEADPDPYTFWHSSQSKGSGLNLVGYSNSEVDTLLVEGRALTDTTARAEKYKAFQALLAKDLPVLYLYQSTYGYALPKKLQHPGIEQIVIPSDRFSDITSWYIKTKRPFGNGGRHADVAELVYAYVSEAYGANLEGSSPSIRTKTTTMTFCQRDEPALVSSQKITPVSLVPSQLNIPTCLNSLNSLFPFFFFMVQQQSPRKPGHQPGKPGHRPPGKPKFKGRVFRSNRPGQYQDPQGQTQTKVIRSPAGDKLRIMVLGGCEEVGRNCTLIEYKNDIILVDMGLQFPEEDMPGVDYIIPNMSYLKGKEKNIRGVIITHGHYDHIGAIRTPSPTSATRRSTLCPCPRPSLNAAKRTFHTRQLNVKITKVSDVLRLGNLTVSFFHINHSIPDAVGIVIDTPMGRVCHTGDWKFDFHPEGTEHADFQQIAALGKKVCYASWATLPTPTMKATRSPRKSLVKNSRRSLRKLLVVSSLARSRHSLPA